jgi:hypothetical protein
MYPSEGQGGWWEWYTNEVAARYARVGRTFPDDPGSFLWHSRMGHDAYPCRTEAELAPLAAKHFKELEDALGITEPVEPVEPVEPGDRLCVPVNGYIRTEGGFWADDSGPRSLRYCSWFAALRHYRDNPGAVREELKLIAQHWQGVRIFWHVWTANGWAPGYEVDPRWPDFDQVFTGFLRDCQALGLRVSISCGDMQDLCPDGNEDDEHRRIAQLAASVDQWTVSHWGIWNEGWQNSARGTDPAYAAHLSEIVQHAYPWNAHALTDTNEEPANWQTWGRYPANNVMIHGERGWPNCMNRAYNTKYEGRPGTLINFDEPTGLGPDITTPLQTPEQLFGLYTVMLITGGMLTYFGGHGLKSWQQPGDLAKDWGFRELPALWRQMKLPEDVRGWAVVPGHKAEAAVSPTSFENSGRGPHRCDGIQTYDEAWYVVSAGRDSWDLRTRRTADVTIWRASGPQHLGVLGRDAQIPTNGPAEQAIVVYTRRA